VIEIVANEHVVPNRHITCCRGNRDGNDFLEPLFLKANLNAARAASLA
jgi:hypothetical protein